MPLQPNSETRNNLSTLEQIFVAAQNLGIYNCFFTGGEFFLHPAWKEILILAKKHNLRRFIITNGSLINAEDIDFIAEHVQGICLSFHAATPKIYTHVMGIEDLQAQYRIRNVIGEISCRGIPVTLFFSPLHHNAHELKATVDYLQDLGKLKLARVNINRILPVGYAQDIDRLGINLTIDDHRALAVDAVKLKQAGVDVKFEGLPMCFLSNLLNYSMSETADLDIIAKCMMGYHAVAVDYDGFLKACPCTGELLKPMIFDLKPADLEFCTIRSFLGLNSWQSLLCKQCSFEQQCGGGCPMACFGNIAAPDPLVEET